MTFHLKVCIVWIQWSHLSKVCIQYVIASGEYDTQLLLIFDSWFSSSQRMLLWDYYHLLLGLELKFHASLSRILPIRLSWFIPPWSSSETLSPLWLGWALIRYRTRWRFAGTWYFTSLWGIENGGVTMNWRVVDFRLSKIIEKINMDKQTRTWLGY